MSSHPKPWWNRWVALVTLVAATTAGTAALISNAKVIGEAVGLISKEEPLKIGLSATSIFYQADPAKDQDATIIMHAYKIGDQPARNCRLEGEADGYPLRVKFTNFGTSFSMPSGPAKREITAVVMRNMPNAPRLSINKPTITLICDNIGSQAVVFELP